METIAPENLLGKISELSEGQTIFIDFTFETSNKLELLTLQIQSAEKLFQSYMSDRVGTASEMSLKKFLETYADLVREKERIFRDESIWLLGTKVYNFCNIPTNKLKYYLDFRLKKLVISKMPEVV